MRAATNIGQPRDHLVGRRADGWLTGWLAVALWIASWVATRAGHPLGSLRIPLYWPAAALSAMHFGMTYHVAYAGGIAAVRRRPFALAIGPALLCVALGTIVVLAVHNGATETRRATELAILSVYLLTTWHYVKQVYGVARIGARYRNVRLSSLEARVLRFGLYPLWAMGAGQVLVRGGGTRFAGFAVDLDLVPHEVFSMLRIVAWCCAGAIAYVIVATSRRAGVRPPALVVAPYLAAFLWLAAPVDFYGTFLALGALHGLQYLACCRRVETGFGLPRLNRHTALRWAELFGGAACGGLLISMWIPGFLNRTFAVDGAPLLFTAVFFVFLNLHHYLIDAVIWRSNGSVVRSMTVSTPRHTQRPAFEPSPA